MAAVRDTGAGPRVFPCTLGGEVARGRRLLVRGLGLVSLVMLAVAVFCFVTGRLVPGVLALALAFAPQFALRLFLDSEPERLLLTGSGPDARLDVELESGVRESLWPGRAPLPEEGAEESGPGPAPAPEGARRLDAEEIRYLARLAERAGLVLGGGSFDTRRLGVIDLYATDLSRAVRVEGASEDGRIRTWVVTPDDPEAFVRAITATISPS